MIKQKHTNLKGSEQKFASEPFFCTFVDAILYILISLK